MSLNLHLLKASGELNKFESIIRAAFEKAAQEVQDLIALKDIDVVIDDDAFSAIPETGVGGYSASAHLLYIHIDPKHADLKNKLDFEIRSTLTHELHHCARWAAIGYGKTLLEAIVSEGLADHFDIEVNGGAAKPWSIALSADELETILVKAKSEFHSTDYNHTDWFYGSENIPRWSGYSLGYKLVGDYLSETKQTASKLVDEPASTFLKL